MANRVVDQVVEGENDGRSIGPDRRHVRRHIYFEPNVAVGQLPAESLRRFGNERCRFQSLERIDLGDVGHAGVGEQVVHQTRQAPLLAHEQVRVPLQVVVGLDASSHQRLSHRPDRRERRLQLVGDRGDEIGANRRDGGACPCRAGGGDEAEREQSDACADDRRGFAAPRAPPARTSDRRPRWRRSSTTAA